MVNPNEVAIDEGCVLVEDVVVGFKVENIAFLELILLLNFVHDDKSHVAEA